MANDVKAVCVCASSISLAENTTDTFRIQALERFLMNITYACVRWRHDGTRAIYKLVNEEKLLIT